MIRIRPARESEFSFLPGIYRRAVEVTALPLYSPEQIRSWAEWADFLLTRKDMGFWLVAVRDGEVVGFGHLCPDDYLSLLYVDPSVNRQGVGGRLCEALEREAFERGARRISTAASHVSRALFLKRGYEVDFEENVVHNGVQFTRARMSMQLG